MKGRQQLMRLAHITGDIGELRQHRDDPELKDALELIRAVLDRVAGEIAAGTVEWKRSELDDPV